MMNKKIFSALIALVVVAALCCACTSAATAVKNSDVANDPGATSAFTLSHSALTLPLDGSNGRLYAFHAETPTELQWSTQDSSVATVDKGWVVPVTPGTTVVSCTDGVNTTSCTITVSADIDMDYVLRLLSSSWTVPVGSTGKVEYAYTGPGAIAIFSNNPQVLHVENGCYTAVSPGTAVITCTDGIRHTQCVVDVTESSPAA